MRRLGLIGRHLGHSFSEEYFQQKFRTEGLEQDYRYELFELEDLGQFDALCAALGDALLGFNVTIPYKEAVIDYLDELDDVAAQLNAVNTIKRLSDGRLKGYNTDVLGFEQSLLPFLSEHRIKEALVLGSGGASKAVQWVLKKHAVAYRIVSRQKKGSALSYASLTCRDVNRVQLIVNTTPLGMYPDIDSTPMLPFDCLGPEHIVYDLVYNPKKTLLLSRAEKRGCIIKNGLEMLQLQAEASWKIWTMSEKDYRLELPDFENTQKAFAGLSDQNLKSAARLFRLMGKPWLVRLGTAMAIIGLKWRLPFVQSIIRRSVFPQFVGGESLEASQKVINELYARKCATVLDYGIEGKSTEEAFDQVVRQTIKSIDFAQANKSVPVISLKISAIANNDLLERIQSGDKPTDQDARSWQKLVRRLDAICVHAHDRSVGLFIDAEESWIQDSIDRLVQQMMERYNQNRAIVYNTYQMYRKDKLEQLKKDFEQARSAGYFLGAKLVRGAYMDKERARAEELNYPSPICDTKQDTDHSFNEGIRFCVSHYRQIACCNASHNIESNRLLAELIARENIQKDHPHLNFSQLYGMSDYISFNLADAGYNVAKYLPYAPVREILPYLIRRAKENTSITDDVGRELYYIHKELKRRGLN